MDPRLLRYYERELQHVREMGAEFAQEYPKVAGRLGLEGIECADPYVERLLEGFAFLAARVQLKLDAEFPRFTQHLLEAVYPHYLAPTPSMAVVQLEPDPSQGTLAAGFALARGTVLRGVLGKGEQTACEYRTAHAVTLWPLEIAEAEYLATGAAVAYLGVRVPPACRAGVRLRLRTAPGLEVRQLSLDRLTLFLRGGGAQAVRLYEQLLGGALGVVVRGGGAPDAWQDVLPASALRPVGFGDDQALLPFPAPSFQGYRLLHEYFAFPARYLFVELAGLGASVRRAAGEELELVVPLARAEPLLEGAIGPESFALHCTPAVNLFPKRCDRIHLAAGEHEYHVVPDRTRPMDYEVYRVAEVTGHGAGTEPEQAFRPLYAPSDLLEPGARHAYYTVAREPRVLSDRQRLHGPRSSYVGSEVFVALVDPDEAPLRTDLRELTVTALCTNRDLPLLMAVGKGATDFTLESGAPVRAARCLAGPTAPGPSWAEGATTWRVISHLTLNYLSLADTDARQGAVALRELLGLYGQVADRAVRRQIEGVRSVAARPITRRLPIPGPIVFGRGLGITVTCDEAAFEGSGVFLLGAVLEEFFARYASINTFTELTLSTLERGEVMRWPARTGRRQTL